MDINFSSHTYSNHIDTSLIQSANDPLISQGSDKISDPIKYKSSLSNLQVGDQIRGEIVDSIHNFITLQTELGEFITAKLLTNHKLNIGDLAQFFVNSMDNNTISLSIIDDAITHTQHENITVSKALSEAGLSQTPKNIEIVQNLIKNNLPINKETLQRFIKLSHLHKELPTDTLILMDKNNLPFDKPTINQVLHYTNNEHQMIHSLNTIQEDLTNLLLDTSMKHVNVNELKNLNIRFFTLLLDYNDSSITKQMNPSQAENTIIEQISETQYKSDIVNGLDDVPNSIINNSELLSKESQVLNNNSPFHMNSMQNEETKFTQIKNLIADLPTMDDENFIQIISSENYKEFIRNTLRKKWSITPKEIDEENSIAKKYKEITNDLEHIKELLLNNDSSFSKNINTKIDQFNENMDFMRLINNIFEYVQLPLQLKEKDVHGDLYVYKNKKNTAKEDGKFRLLLHLEMPSLGDTNIHMTIDKQSIDTQFFIEDPFSRELISKNLDLLEVTLLSKGYRFKGEVNVNYKPIDFVEDILGHNNSDTLISRYSFDARA